MRSGYGDLALRMAANLVGAPALSLPAYRDYRQDVIIGASLLVTAPTINGVPKADLQQNGRWGTTASQALDRHNSVKFYFGTGALVRAGTKFDTAGINWQYRWGAGL